MWDPFLKCWIHSSNLSSTPQCSLRNYYQHHRLFPFSHCCITLPLLCSSGALSTFCGWRLVFGETFNLFPFLIIASGYLYLFLQLFPFSCYLYACLCFFIIFSFPIFNLFCRVRWFLESLSTFSFFSTWHHSSFIPFYIFPLFSSRYLHPC